MSNGSKGRVSKVIPFISRLEQDRLANLDALMNKAKMMKLEGFNDIDWSPSVWEIDGGRLHKQAGRNIKSVSINFNFSPKLGGAPLEGSWSDLAKSLLVLRLHRKNQNTSNQRQFITAVGYVAFAASNPNTGDNNMVPLVIGLLVVSAIVIVVLLVISGKKKKR